MDDGALIERVRAGEESAFVELVERYNDALLRVARTYVASAAVAEEVVQDTWLGVLRGLRGFEGRSSFKTWLFRILVNRARSTGVREARTTTLEEFEPAVDPGRFDRRGAWSDPPVPFSDAADERLDASALAPVFAAALERLPPTQRRVVVLRDVEGLSGPEVCETLGLSEANQRVLLHRGRSRLRAALEAAGAHR